MMTAEERIQYYRDPAVRARITEFLGAAASHGPTCEYLTAGDERSHRLNDRRPQCSLDSLFASGSEIYRSLWDEDSLVVDFDIEYVNFDHPAEAFLNPERVFALQQPVVEAIEDLLRSHGIEALHLLTGRGHHFVWRVRRDSAAYVRLAALGKGSASLWALETEPHSPEGKSVSSDLAHAFAGLGVVMEFLAHEVKRIAARSTTIPVELTAVEVGPSAHGREMISLDISEYGDPLYSRMVRAPFSVYLKASQEMWIFPPFGSAPPTLVAIPMTGLTTAQAIAFMREPFAATQLARSVCTRIPESSGGTEKLIERYEQSALADFHRWYYAEEPHPASAWPATYDRLDLELLPVCAQMMLTQPNDLLLRPAYIRRLVRMMLALGWHPRHVAGLIHSKYARPFGWTQLRGYDPLTRADFYTRIFAGLFVTGADDLVDLNCVSAQEQQVCSFSPCGHNLEQYRESALYRRDHAKLAHRPFNRLLLQPEHS